MRIKILSATAIGLALAASPTFGGTWQTVTQAPASALNNPLLLTDGTVIIFQEIDQLGPNNVYRLTPDALGSYVNGTWSQIAPLPNGYEPFAFASAVLPDGRVIVEGGECNSAVVPCTSNSVWSSLGAIYDPITNVWTPVSPPNGPGWINTDAPGSCNGGIGDAPGIVLPNGTFMLGASCANPPVEALFNATNLSWSSTGAPLYYQDEQGYTLLQNGKVLTINVSDFQHNTATNMTAETYDPATGTWSAVASLPVLLTDPLSCFSREIGPAVTRHDGTVVAFGGVYGSCVAPTADPTAIYNPSNNTWIQGPNIPTINGSFYSLADAPAALLPNGNILFAASPGFHTTPTHFFEFTTTNGINQVPDDVYFSGSQTAEYLNFLVLPTGQILATDLSSYVEIYTPTGSPNPAWTPTVTSVAGCVAPGGSYVLNGTQLNGLSQGAAYGDDWQAATNYPLVRIVNNATAHVFYARTYGHSTMSIAPGQVGSTNFKVAANTEIGASTLYAVANGIPSAGKAVTVDGSCAASARTHDFNGDGKSDILWRNTSTGDTSLWLMNGSQFLSLADLGVIPLSWQIVGQRDFDGDGKADLLWQNSNGDTSIWLMNGTQIVTAQDLGVISGWQVVGTGDFNGDGKADILWRNTNGDTSIWLMNGTQILAAQDFGVIPPSWAVTKTGDFNGDGKADILWRNTSTGDTSIWLMNANGTQLYLAGAPDFGVIPLGWNVAGTGDFNGDGISDILWHNSNGDTSMWLLKANGTNVYVSAAVDFGVIPSGWNVALTGDFDGNGMSDILWRNTSTGDTSIWFMNGTQISNAVDLGIVPLAWVIQGAGAD